MGQMPSDNVKGLDIFSEILYILLLKLEITVKLNCGQCVFLQTAQPLSPTCASSLPTSLNFNHLPRPRKPRDTKPKMRKLKYHQYIPPDQRGGSGTGGMDTMLYYI